MDKLYVEAVRLLLATMPPVFKSPVFVMKGGTAINLFVQDMPRLSVDIDVVYADHTQPRAEALAAISGALKEVQEQLHGAGLRTRVAATDAGDEIKLFVAREGTQIKVEVNHVFRGTILPVEPRRLAEKARNLFTTEVTAPMLAVPELYGSKLVAALDRQHPRDFFDVLGMYQTVGLTPEIVECFVCYLAGHNRPVHEVLFSRDQDISLAFENEFVGMTREPIDLDQLVEVRWRLRAELPSRLSEKHRRFLIGLVRAEPDWSLMACPHLKDMPAIRWKLENLAKLKKSNAKKFAAQTDELLARFDASRA
jgi:hypothetical protein